MSMNKWMDGWMGLPEKRNGQCGGKISESEGSEH